MGPSEQPALRILALAANYSPTLFIHLLRPLRNQSVAIQILTEDVLAKFAGSAPSGHDAASLAAMILDKAKPDVVFSSRYNGPLAEDLLTVCRARGIAYIFHLDDNLLEVPLDQGADKVAYHLHPKRVGALRRQLEESSLVYLSTEALHGRLRELVPRMGKAFVGPICAAVDPLPMPAPRPAGAPPLFGYAASAGHMADLKLALPGIIAALERFPDATFELIGSIGSLPELGGFGDRVRHERKFLTYDEYVLDLNRRAWDLALAPLCDTPFTRMKTYTKWVEYAAAGIPALVSDHPIYRDRCADGAAILVREGDWAEALPMLLADAPRRQAIAAKAQQKVAAEFPVARLREQLVEALRQAGAWAAVTPG